MQQQFRVCGLIVLVLGIIGVLATITASVLIGVMSYGTNVLVSNAFFEANEKGMQPMGSYSPFTSALYGILGYGIILIPGMIISVLYIIAGAGLIKQRPWARVMTIIISIVSLPGLPFWTALGVYGLWLMLSAEGMKGWEAYIRGDVSPAV